VVPVTLAAAFASVGTTGGAGAQQAAPGTPIVLPARQVSTDLRPGRAYNQPQLLVDPMDENTLVIAGANYNAGECLDFLSLDGGTTWRPGKALARPPQYKTCVRPDLGPYLGAKFGPTGTLYLASVADNAGGQQVVNDLYMARSEDLGDSWDFTVAHKGLDAVEFTQLDGTKKTGGEHFSLVRMGVDPKDPRYVYAGVRYQQADRTAPFGTFGVIPIRNMIAASSDGGKTFSELVDPMAGVNRSDMPPAQMTRRRYQTDERSDQHSCGDRRGTRADGDRDQRADDDDRLQRQLSPPPPEEHELALRFQDVGELQILSAGGGAEKGDAHADGHGQSRPEHRAEERQGHRRCPELKRT
jgi:hypothetical protein